MALADSDPKLIAEMLTTDFGRKAPRRPRAAPITLAHGTSTSWAASGVDGGMAGLKVRCLITRIAVGVLDVVVGAEAEVVVRLLRRGVHPAPLIPRERPLLVVGRHNVLPQLGAEGFDEVPGVPDEREVAQQRVVSLK